MQRTFGGDRRFELDSRFLESEDEEVSNSRDKDEEAAYSDAKHLLSERNSETISSQNDDEISRSLAEEKAVAMKVLSNIFGGNFRADHRRESQEKNPEFRYL